MADPQATTDRAAEPMMLDVTFPQYPAFCPYEEDTGAVVVGMTIITDRCPGKLVGVFHSDGQEQVEAWVAKNPDWYERFK